MQTKVRISDFFTCHMSKDKQSLAVRCGFWVGKKALVNPSPYCHKYLIEQSGNRYQDLK